MRFGSRRDAVNLRNRIVNEISSMVSLRGGDPAAASADNEMEGDASTNRNSRVATMVTMIAEASLRMAVIITRHQWE